MVTQAQGMEPVLLDDINDRLLEVRSARPGKQVQLSDAEQAAVRRLQRDLPPEAQSAVARSFHQGLRSASLNLTFSIDFVFLN